MTVRWGLAVVTAMLMAGGTRSADAQRSPPLSGVVRDSATSRPVPGVVVTVVGPGPQRHTRTDERGAFSFASAEPGRYVVSARSIGYEPYQGTVEIMENGDPLSITLRRLATLDTVYARRGRSIVGVVGTLQALRPIAGASVQVIGTSKTVKTDSAGRFFLPLERSGVYVIRAYHRGFETQTLSLTVNRDEPVELAVLLDSTSARPSVREEIAWREFELRVGQRRTIRSAVVSRTELLSNGNMPVTAALQRSSSFSAKALRLGASVCTFVDGIAAPSRPAWSFDAEEVEAVELYAAAGDASNTLASRWPRGVPCTNTGLPGTSYGSDVVRYVVIWLKK